MGREAILSQLTETELLRFDAHVWKPSPEMCWPWVGSTTYGYGAVTIRGISFRAHRVAFILGNGHPAPRMVIGHRCDYRRCCNPAHLFAQTQKENVAEQFRRGRHPSQGFVYVEPPLPEMPLEVRLASLRQLLIANFWAHVPADRDPTKCWEWTGTRAHGYGRIEMKCRALGLREGYQAHRLSYEVNVGPIPDELDALHSCDNPPCVNPAHLRPGTHLENMTDRTVRGRGFRPVGELSGRTHLTEADVRAIRAADKLGLSRREQAIKYDVHVQTIHEIVWRKSWKHVPDEPDQVTSSIPSETSDGDQTLSV